MTCHELIRQRRPPMTSMAHPSRIVRAPLTALLLAGAAAGCGEPPTAPLRHVSTLSKAAQAGTPLRCTAVAGDSATVVIGPAGGTVAAGQQVLVVPKGALRAPVAITAVVRPDTVNLVRFAPDGLVFLKTATLTMYYGNCDADGPGPRPKIALVNDQLQILAYVQLPKGKGPNPPYVWGKLSHFSNYAVAW